MATLLQTAVKNSVWTGIGSLGTALLGLLFAGVTIRWLGESEAGFAIAVTTVAGINGVLGGLGLSTAAVRAISKAQSQQDFEIIRRVSGVCLAASLALGLLGLLLFSLGAPFILRWTKYSGSPETGTLFCVLSGFTFLFNQLSANSGTILTALQRFDFETKLALAAGMANGLAGILLIRLFPTILVVAIVSVSLSLIRVLCEGVVLSRILGFLPLPHWDKALFTELWSFGRWSYFSSLFSILGDGLDKVLITAMFGGAVLPFYALPQRIYSAVHTVISQQCSYIFPMLVPIVETDAELFEKIAERYRWFVGVLAGLLYGLLFFAAKSLLSFFVTPMFADRATLAMEVFCIVGFFQALGIVNYQVSYAKGDAKSNFYYLLWNGTLALPVIYLLGSRFGFEYCVLGQLSLLVSTYLHYVRVCKAPPWSGLGRFFSLHTSVFVALGIVALFVLLLRTTPWVNPQSLINTGLILSLAALLYAAAVYFIERTGNQFDSRIGTLQRAVALIRRRAVTSPVC